MQSASASDLRDIPDGEGWYLASPYTKYRTGLDGANRVICRVAARLLRERVPLFSPIAHTHAIAVHGEMALLDHAGWMAADRWLMIAAYGMIVVKMPGWQDSRGVGEEIDYFTAAGKPIEYLQPLPEELRA